MIRKARFAGSWYAGDPLVLKQNLKEFFLIGPGAIPQRKKDIGYNVIGIVSPHAGHIYSGWIAAYGYFDAKQTKDPETVFLIGPDHYGAANYPISIYNEGAWETPLGNLPIDETEANRLLDLLKIPPDPEGHILEHSLEIQTPFIKFLWEDTKIVPIIMADQSFGNSIRLAEALKQIFVPEKHLIIASSDFSHYISANEAKRKDMAVIELIINKKPKEAYEQIIKTKTTLCGYGPILSLVNLTKTFDNSEIVLLKYGNSGDVTGDYTQVVAYASISSRLK